MESGRVMSAAQKTDKLLSKLKLRAAELHYGKIFIDVTVHDGRITGIEVKGQTESWRVDN